MPRFQFDSSFRYEKRPMLEDLDGKRLRNTAGEDYTKPYERNVKILVFNIKRREYANPLKRQIKYQDAVNASVFWGQAAGQVLVESYLVDGEGKGNFTTGWNVKYSIAIRPQNAGRWDEIEIPSMGFNEKGEPGPANSFALKEIINKATGKAYTTEQYLDSEGHWLDRLSPGFEPHLDKYRPKEKLELSALRLPNLGGLVYSPLLEETSGQ